MKPPIIAIEGDDLSGVNSQVDTLEQSLNKEGLRVGVLKFPRFNHYSSYFVKQYVNGTYNENTNPYASSIFYTLDRFDAQGDINKFIATKDVVILSNYIGYTLAQQGSRFNVKNQKQFFMWLDSLESEFFGNTRPDHSIILQFNKSSKIAETFNNLCSSFPKDFTILELGSKDNSTLSKNIFEMFVRHNPKPTEKPTTTNLQTKTKRNSASVRDILRSQSDVANISITKEYIEISDLNKNQQQIYKSGTENLNHIRNKILKDTPENKKKYVTEFLGILGSIVSYTGEKVKQSTAKQGEFENVLHDSVKLSYSSGIKTGATIVDVLPRNQMTVVNDILFAVTDLSQEQIVEQSNKISYEKKTELIRSYIKDDHGTGFNNVNYTFNIGATLHDILWLKRYLQKETITIQDPSPRNGYDVPKWADKQSHLYEEYFDSLIELNSILSNTPAAKYLVALGNVASARLKLSYHDVKKLSAAINAPQIAHDIVMASAVTHPILYE